MGLFYKFLIFFYFMFSGIFLAVNSIPKPPVPPPQNKPATQPLPQPANPETKMAETQEIKKEEKPLFSVEQPTVPSLPEAKNESGFSVRYPLIPPYAFAVIKWDDTNKEMVYEIEEPQLAPEEKKTLSLLEEGIKELINISFISVKDKDTVLIYLEKNIRVLLTELSIELTKESFLKIMYYIYRDFVGLNELEPLMNDYFIEDVECNGVNTPVYIVHRKYRNIKTSLIYTDVKTMMSFVEKIAQKAGKYISYAEPLLDASLPDGTRVQAVFSKDVATRGPSYTLRKFTKTPWSPIALVGKGTATPEIYAYLWMAVEYENSMMIIGGTGTGKTSFVNTVAFFIPPQARIVSIEDTKELQLEHENWLPSVARSGVGLTNLVGQKYGEVSLFDLLKASFRQRPDYIIVGEVRGAEAFVLFQAFASIRGDEEIFVLKNNKPWKIKIKDLEKEDINKLNAISYNTKEKRYEILPIKAFIKHPKRKTLYRITTKSGREVTITGDHSIFTYCDGIINETRGEDLLIGGTIIIPSSIPCGYNNISRINLLEYLPDLRVYSPNHVIEASHKLGYHQANNAAGVSPITDYYSVGVVSKPNAMNADKFMQLMKTAKVDYKLEDLQVKFDGLSYKWPVFFEVSDEFLKLLGYYLSEGSLNTSGRNYRMAFYNSNEEVLKDMENCIIKLTSRKPASRVTDRGWGSALELSFNNKILYEFIKRYCKTKLQKRIPDFIYGLDKRKIGIFFGALYTGDGYLRDKGIVYSTTSKELANDVAQLLQVFGIVATIRKRNRYGRKTTDYEIDFYANYKKNEFLKYVKPIGKNCNIKNGIEDKKLLGDLYIDKIKSIEIINLDKPEHVYDISVPGNQNFIGGFGGILLHNSGHPGMATMHAEGVETMVKRLQTAPINLSGSLIETLAAVVVMTQSKIKGKEVRKVNSVDEIIKVTERGESGSVQINTVFKWDPKTDKFFLNPDSKVFENIALHYGFTKEQIFREFKLRTNLLKALFKRKISDFKDVQKIIHEYYKAPEDVLKRYGVI